MQPGLHAYAAVSRTGLSGRSLEAAVLRRCAAELQRAQNVGHDDLATFIAALERNRKAWSIIAQEVHDESCGLPADLRRNMLVTARAVFKRTEELAMGGDPEGMELLITINRRLAAGLEGDPG